jgi:hypothetical protein
MKLYVASNGSFVYVAPRKRQLHLPCCIRVVVRDGQWVYFPVLNKDGTVVHGADDEYMVYAYCMTVDEIKHMEQVIQTTAALAYDPSVSDTSNLVVLTEAVRGALEVAFK